MIDLTCVEYSAINGDLEFSVKIFVNNILHNRINDDFFFLKL